MDKLKMKWADLVLWFRQKFGKPDLFLGTTICPTVGQKGNTTFTGYCWRVDIHSRDPQEAVQLQTLLYDKMQEHCDFLEKNIGRPVLHVIKGWERGGAPFLHSPIFETEEDAEKVLNYVQPKLSEILLASMDFHASGVHDKVEF